VRMWNAPGTIASRGSANSAALAGATQPRGQLTNRRR
jgi:hypothetical protein